MGRKKKIIVEKHKTYIRLRHPEKLNISIFLAIQHGEKAKYRISNFKHETEFKLESTILNSDDSIKVEKLRVENKQREMELYQYAIDYGKELLEAEGFNFDKSNLDNN